jgi:1-acyl-sn-glycerol-3-phosphate acyltransferase
MADRGRRVGREPTAARSPGAAAASAFRLFRGGRRRTRARWSAPGSDDVVARLAALERQVEQALRTSGLRAASGGGPWLGSAADELLAAVAGASRFSLREALAWGCRRVDRALADLGLTGREPAAAALGRAFVEALYRWWWRVEAIGLERIPARGRMLLVTNRASTLLPWEALMIALALAREHPRRRAHLALDDGLGRVPLVWPALVRLGAVRGTAANVCRLLERDEAVIVLPEGARAHRKTFRQRYRLASFGRGAFARLAIETGAPVVPVAVVGAEEARLVLARLAFPGSLLGLPPLPITPTFPWLGVAGLVPLPTKWTLHIGEPLDVAAAYAPGRGADGGAVAELCGRVRERLQALVLEGLDRRGSRFRPS